MKNLNEQIEAQQLISNINMMREKIGIAPADFKYLWKQSVEWLRNEQDTTIQHYNEAIKNANK
jgi:hypothetical protein